MSQPRPTMPHPQPGDPFPVPIPPPNVVSLVKDAHRCPFCCEPYRPGHYCPDLAAAVGHVHWPPRGYARRTFIPHGSVA